MYVCLVCICLRAIVPASINAPWEFVNLNAYNSKNGIGYHVWYVCLVWYMA